MNDSCIGHQSWQGKNIRVNILFARAGLAQQIWIEHDNDSILADSGDGTLRDIAASKLDYTKLKGILITHGHFDHMGGLYSLLAFMRMIGSTLPVHMSFTIRIFGEYSSLIDPARSAAE